jgi:hypothetical protein
VELIFYFYVLRDNIEISEILIGLEFDMKALYGQQAQILHAVRILQKKDGKNKTGLLPVLPLGEMDSFKSLERCLNGSPELQDDLVSMHVHLITLLIIKFLF